VSQQTGFEDAAHGRNRRINFLNLETVCRMCGTGRTPSLLMTGKGEPTLFPNEVTAYLQFFEKRPFAPRELQTNGLLIGRLAERGSSGAGDLITKAMLERWRHLGLNTIALSVVSVHDEANARIYHPQYPPLTGTIALLRGLGFTVRLCVMMMRGEKCVTNINELDEVVDFCRPNAVGQLTARPIMAAYASEGNAAAEFVRQNGLPDDAADQLCREVGSRAHVLYHLAHGATVYDYNGQNVCLSNCLTSDAERSAPGEFRSLIFFSNGLVTTSWDHARAAAILQGDLNSD
jgi:MoaA/NifB/PqqE/SkfB family radical SAM enzyme